MLTKFLNNYGYMILGGAMIIGFSAFKGAEAYAGKKLDPVTIYFHGDETNSSQVSSAFRWTTTPNGESCNDVDLMACSQVVDQTDLISSSRLDSTKIQLGATPTSGGNFIPSKAGGSSSTPFSPTNRG